MPDHLISPIGRQPPAGAAYEPAQSDHSVAAREAAPREPAGAASRPAGEDDRRPASARETAAPKPRPETLRNIRLQFQVDSKTNHVTVLMIDQATNKVIRTIPPEELQHLREGELVELPA